MMQAVPAVVRRQGAGLIVNISSILGILLAPFMGEYASTEHAIEGLSESLDHQIYFAGHQMHTPWDALHRAYFNGEALWTYLATPFAFAMDGFRVEETAPWQEGKETWRVLRVYFPGAIETHCQVQDFFFDEAFELRRHDYSVNIAGGFPAAQLMLEYTEAGGIRLPSKRRAYTRGPDRRPIRDMLMVSIDISEVTFS